MEENISIKSPRWKYRKLALIAVGILLVVLSVYLIVEKVRAFPSSALFFTPTSKIVGSNQDFTLDAMIDPRTNQVTAVELHLAFDQTKFRLDSISTAGSPFSVTLQAASIDNISGTASIIVGVSATNPPSPVITISKIATLSFHSLAGVSNSPVSFAASSVAAALGESTDVITERNGAQVTVDVTAPSGGSITYTNGYFRTLSVPLTVGDGTDAEAGINTASRIIQRHSATLTGTTCGSYGAWAAVTPAGTYPNFTDTTVVNGNCYEYQYLISDNASNQATYTAGSATVKADTAAPTLAQVTAVSSPANDPTPDYTFSSTEAGSITYGGSCSSGTASAVSGNNTVTFNTLASGTYSNCTVRVTDAAGNASNILAVNSFTIDATAPTVANVTSTKADGTYGAGTVIDISVTFSEAVTSTGNATVTLDTGGSCTFSASSAATRSCNYTVQAGDASADLTVASISGTIADQLGNAMTNFIPATNLGANKNIIISATRPVLAEVTAIPAVTSDITPDFTFSSTIAGAIAYSGDCSSAVMSAISGNNTVTLNALSLGTHSNCAITVTDALGNASTPLSVMSFNVTYRSDFNLDREVDIYDYNNLITNFGGATCGNTADADKNCRVDIFDYNILIEDFGRSI